MQPKLKESYRIKLPALEWGCHLKWIIQGKRTKAVYGAGPETL